MLVLGEEASVGYCARGRDILGGKQAYTVGKTASDTREGTQKEQCEENKKRGCTADAALQASLLT